MNSQQAQITERLRALHAGLNDGRDATWAADQSLKRLRGSLAQAGRAGAPARGSDPMLAGAMRSLDQAEQRRQQARAAVDRWLSRHGAAGGGGGPARAGGGAADRSSGAAAGLLGQLLGAPTLGDAAPGFRADASEDAKRLAVAFGAGAGSEVLCAIAEAFVPGFGAATEALPLVAQVLVEVAQEEGITKLLEIGGEQVLKVPKESGSWHERNDWRIWSSVFVASALITGATMGAPLWAAAPLSGALNVAGWILPKKT
ncbi:MAG: hypothetical protein JHC95_09865 [Solirubrobacteraceae bacterium]|nr:hypothetical protein [Solirubrobacteraceae bacterium]